MRILDLECECGSKLHPNFYASVNRRTSLLFLCGTEIVIDEDTDRIVSKVRSRSCLQKTLTCCPTLEEGKL